MRISECAYLIYLSNVSRELSNTKSPLKSLQPSRFYGKIFIISLGYAAKGGSGMVMHCERPLPHLEDIGP